MGQEEIHKPGPSPLRFNAVNDPTMHEDPVLQKEVKPLVSATTGVSFSGIPSPGYVPSDSNLAVGPNDNWKWLTCSSPFIARAELRSPVLRTLRVCSVRSLGIVHPARMAILSFFTTVRRIVGS